MPLAYAIIVSLITLDTPPLAAAVHAIISIISSLIRHYSMPLTPLMLIIDLLLIIFTLLPMPYFR
jgi:hypothetical protein